MTKEEYMEHIQQLLPGASHCVWFGNRLHMGVDYALDVDDLQELIPQGLRIIGPRDNKMALQFVFPS